MKKLIFILPLILVTLAFSGCSDYNIVSQSTQYAQAVSVSQFYKQRIPHKIQQHKPQRKLQHKQIHCTSHINGNKSILPYINANFKNAPLWSILQNVSMQTSYTFDTKGINLAKKYSVSGVLNLAEFLSKVLCNNKVTINLKTKRITIWR